MAVVLCRVGSENQFIFPSTGHLCESTYTLVIKYNNDHMKLHQHNYMVRNIHYHKAPNTHIFIIKNFICHLCFVVFIYKTIL